MLNKGYDVTGIGNAIVDIVSRIDDDFLCRNGVRKGGMTLVDQARADGIYRNLGLTIEISGGSVANTVVGLAALGARVAFIGKVRDDRFGQVFRRDINLAGVRFDTAASTSGPTTGCCIVLVTPDGQRSMNTYLGACAEMRPEDIDLTLIGASKIVYLEGYLWDPPLARLALLEAARATRESGGENALSLSDSFCVERHRNDFLDLLTEHVDILFANEHELMALYATDDLDTALQAVRGHCGLSAITRGDKGAIILAGDRDWVLDAEPVPQVVDSTGAGDLYAAGFLHGYCQGLEPAECGLLGGRAAAEVLGYLGARPHDGLGALALPRSLPHPP